MRRLRGDEGQVMRVIAEYPRSWLRAPSTRRCLIPCAGLRVIRLKNRSSSRFRLACRKDWRSTDRMMKKRKRRRSGSHQRLFLNRRHLLGRRNGRCKRFKGCARPRSSADAPSTSWVPPPDRCRARWHSRSSARAGVPRGVYQKPSEATWHHRDAPAGQLEGQRRLIASLVRIHKRRFIRQLECLAGAVGAGLVGAWG